MIAARPEEPDDSSGLQTGEKERRRGKAGQGLLRRILQASLLHEVSPLRGCIRIIVYQPQRKIKVFSPLTKKSEHTNLYLVS